MAQQQEMVRMDYHNNRLKNSQTPLKCREQASERRQKEVWCGENDTNTIWECIYSTDLIYIYILDSIYIYNMRSLVYLVFLVSNEMLSKQSFLLKEDLLCFFTFSTFCSVYVAV